jgi:DNA-binding MarR family transcriptional regulator
MRQVLLIIAKKPGVSQNEIIRAAKGNSGTIKDVIRALVKYQYIENKGAATAHEYEKTAAGQEWLDKGSRYARHTPGPNAPTNPSASNAAESPTHDDPPFAVETTPEQPKEANTMKNQSDAVDENVKKVVEYIAAHPKCSKTEVKVYTKMQNARAVAARDKAERLGLISWSVKDGNVITDKGRELLPLSAPHDAPPTHDTNANPNDPPKDP